MALRKGTERVESIVSARSAGYEPALEWTMRVRRSMLRAVLISLVVTCAGCAGTPPKVAFPEGQARCEPSGLDACEQAIATGLASGKTLRDLVSRYVAARAKLDEGDPWVAVWQALSRPVTAPAHASQAAIVLEGVPDAIHRAASRLGARTVSVSALPAPGKIGQNELLVAMGGAAGIVQLWRVQGAAAAVFEMFPNDPLGPFMLGLAPIVRDDRAAEHLREHIELGNAVVRAIDAACRLRYVDAAREAERLAALVEAGDNLAEPVLRARYALDLLGAAGITLDPEQGAEKDAAPAQPPVARFPPPAPGDTAYGDVLRVRMAKDVQSEWAVRKARVLAAVEPSRRAAVDALFRGSSDCTPKAAPPLHAARDLAFAGMLAGSIATLPPDEWLGRYTTLVDLVQETRTAWAHIPALLYQRGEVAGLKPIGTHTYRRVNEMGLSHLAAVAQLQSTFPTRYRALSQLPLLYIPGALSDDKLRDALIRLTENTVREKLSRAKTPGEVTSGLLAGLFAGMSYPAALQGAHFAALQNVFTAKLEGDLAQATGWEAALLYAADVAFRFVAGQPVNPGAASDHIGRALGDDPAIAMPQLAALAAGAARYAALAMDGKLVAEIGRFPPERQAAREALRKAIASLGEHGKNAGGPPAQVLNDVTDLADGLIATLSLIRARPAQTPSQTCPGDSPPPDLVAKQALERLADLRKKILNHPRYKQGDSVWIRRVRLFVTLLSDAIDIAATPRGRVEFTVRASHAERTIAGALADWDEPSAKNALAGAYALARGYFAARSTDKDHAAVGSRSAARFLEQHGPDIRRLLSGLAGYFRMDSKDKPGVKVALFDALAALPPVQQGRDLSATMVSYASALYDRRHTDQGDLLLLGTLVLAGLTEAPPSDEAIALASRRSPHVEWALRFLREVWKAKRGAAPDPTVYAGGMRQAAAKACMAESSREVTAVMGAIRDYTEGRHAQARTALDRFLEDAEHRGLRLPSASYRYEEKTATKVFMMSLDVSYGAGLLDSSSSFQVGFGVRSPGQPQGSMTASVTAADSAQSDPQAARYYIHAAALAAVYHFLQADPARATAASARAVEALAGGVRLGSRSIRSDNPLLWGADARALLAVAAELAAEAGQPFLAGDLWTVLRAGLPADSDDDAIAQILARPPIGLGGAGDKNMTKLLERTAQSLKRIASPLSCTRDEPAPSAFDQASCSAYPLALSLRVADVLKKLPRLSKGEAARSPECGMLSVLDGFVAAADQRTYEPDLFTRAVEELRAGGRLYDAAVLLARYRAASHCSPVILSAARTLGRSPMLGPKLRSDLLSVAVNCTVPAVDEALLSDMAILDTQARRLADPTKSFRLMLFAAELGAKSGRWEPLGQLADPTAVDRWMQVSPGAATAALLVDHAAAILTGKPVALERTKSAHALLCISFPPGDRREVCDMIDALRSAPKDKAQREQLARQSLDRLISWAEQAPSSKP